MNDFDLVVSLPSHLTGFVSFEQVSANFSERFESAAAEDADDSAKVNKEIRDYMLNFGRPYRC